MAAAAAPPAAHTAYVAAAAAQAEGAPSWPRQRPAREKGGDGCTPSLASPSAMSENDALVPTLPRPPPWFELYTDEAVASGRAPAPPALPPGPYAQFGVTVDPSRPLVPALSDVDAAALFDEADAGTGKPPRSRAGPAPRHRAADRRCARAADYVQLLRQLNKSLLFSFLELLDRLCEAPDAAVEKMADLETLLVNAHLVVNRFRPVQARAAVRQHMADLASRRRRAASVLGRWCDRVESLMATCEADDDALCGKESGAAADAGLAGPALQGGPDERAGNAQACRGPSVRAAGDGECAFSRGSRHGHSRAGGAGDSASDRGRRRRRQRAPPDCASLQRAVLAALLHRQAGARRLYRRC